MRSWVRLGCTWVSTATALRTWRWVGIGRRGRAGPCQNDVSLLGLIQACRKHPSPDQVVRQQRFYNCTAAGAQNKTAGWGGDEGGGRRGGGRFGQDGITGLTMTPVPTKPSRGFGRWTSGCWFSVARVIWGDWAAGVWLASDRAPRTAARVRWIFIMAAVGGRSMWYRDHARDRRGAAGRGKPRGTLRGWLR